MEESYVITELATGRPSSMPHSCVTPTRPIHTYPLSTLPISLIPCEFTGAKSCNIEWAKKENHYHRYFTILDRHATIVDKPEQKHYFELMACANKIQIELMDLGCDAAAKEILRLAKVYNLICPSDNQIPSSIDDVVSIFGDKGWYDDDVENKRKIIYIITYGIFRKGFNQWVDRAANKWLIEHHIEYDASDHTGKDKRRPKGFVHRLIMHRSSDNITNKVQNVMKGHHQEFITVKKMTVNANIIRYTKYSLGTTNYYLGSIQQDAEHAPLQNFSAAVRKAKRHMTKTAMIELINESYDGHLPDIIHTMPGKYCNEYHPLCYNLIFLSLITTMFVIDVVS